MGCRAFALLGCLWPHGCSGCRRPRPLCVPVGGGPPARRPRRELLLVAPTDLRPPRGLPARSPSAPRASLGASARSPARPRRPRGGLQSVGVSVCCLARPRRRPRAPRQVPPAPSTPVVPGVLMCGSARHFEARPGPAATAQVSRPDLNCRIAEPIPNFARNSPATISNIEFVSAELQRFVALLNVHPIELRAKLRCGVSLLWLSLLLRGIALLG